MKFMKKLSSKLLLALGLIILGVIVWQVIVSKRVIGDMEKISRTRSIEQIQELLKIGDLKSYHSIPCRPFSKIKLNGVNAHILKGKEYAIYVSDYYKRHVEIMITGNELFLSSRKWVTGTENTPIFIFMPEDPQSVYCMDSSNYQLMNNYKIYGFRGDNTLLFCEDNINITTDMPFINVNQKNCLLRINISGLNNSMIFMDMHNSLNIRIKYVQVNIRAEENSRLTFTDEISDSINVNIQLQESDIDDLIINSRSKVGTLSLKGTIGLKEDYYINNYGDTIHVGGSNLGNIIYPNRCDSLIIQLTNNSKTTKELFLSKELSGRFENIDCPENITIERVNSRIEDIEDCSENVIIRKVE